jgi:hypothetical protein
MSVAAVPRGKTKTVLFEVRADQVFANWFEYGLKLDPVDSIGKL